MAERATMIAAVEAHCRALTESDKAGWLAIWADDAVVEDPANVDSYRGIDTLGTTFWSIIELTRPLRLRLKEPVITCGNEAVAVLCADSSWGGETREIDPLIDHFTFGPDGRIATMRAYWDFAARGYRGEMAPDPARRQHMIEVVRTHCRAESAGDRDAWLELYAEEVVFEDPVGTNTFRGREALREQLWPRIESGRPQLRLEEEVIVCGNEAVAVIAADITLNGERRTLRPIIVDFVFDEAGKVRHLRSFFDHG